MKKSSKPNIYDYFDYRKYLHDLVDHLNTKGLYSNRKFAKKAGIRCPGHLRRIIEGKRNLTRDAARRFAQGFDLIRKETDFLLLLTEFNHAKSSDDQKKILEEILSFRGFQNIRKTEVDQYEYFSKWYHIAVLVSLGTPWGQRPFS